MNPYERVVFFICLAYVGGAVLWKGLDKLLTKRLSPAQRWALAASGNLGATWSDVFDRLRLRFSKRELRRMLRDSWSVHSAEEARDMLAWLANEGHSAEFRVFHRELSRLGPGELEPWLATQPEDRRGSLRWLHANLGLFKDGDLVAWDMERLINLARAIYTVGWIDEATAWQHIAFGARRLQTAYGSWYEMSDNYLAGRIWWGGDEASNPRYREAANQMLTRWTSPWIKLPWSTSLA